MSNLEKSLGSNRIRRWENNRLVYYQTNIDKHFWDKNWENLVTEKYYANYIKGKLDELSPYIPKLFDKDDRILEAGCGAARIVVSLFYSGFRNIEGIDNGENVIGRVKEIFPDLPIKQGDVLDIDKPDNYYQGYISLGVMEHSIEGPEPFLKEAYRVLQKGGYALISVPFINPIRKIKNTLGCFNKDIPQGFSFYQYAFQKTEFSQLLNNTGFSIIGCTGVDGLFALRQELHFIFKVIDKIPGGFRIQEELKKSKWINSFGHMILFVCKKV